MLQRRVYYSSIPDVDHVKQVLIEAYNQFNQDSIDSEL